jgi:Skp family chaperone for outer membrane proteins
MGIAATALLGAGFFLEPVSAVQDNKPRFHVINVKRVFDAHPGFKAAGDELKADVTKKEEDLRTVQNAIAAKQKESQRFKNAEDRAPIEKEINDLQFQFAKKQRQYREEMGKAEAEIVSKVYAQMSTIVAEWAKQNGTYLVLRIDEPTAEMPEDARVMTQMSKQVIYHHPNLDLTDIVINEVKTQPVAGRAGK